MSNDKQIKEYIATHINEPAKDGRTSWIDFKKASYIFMLEKGFDPDELVKEWDAVAGECSKESYDLRMQAEAEKKKSEESCENRNRDMCQKLLICYVDGKQVDKAFIPCYKPLGMGASRCSGTIDCFGFLAKSLVHETFDAKVFGKELGEFLKNNVACVVGCDRGCRHTINYDRKNFI